MTSAPASEPTPSSSNFRKYDRRVIRIVEAQFTISTSRLTDSPDDEEILERLVESVKPTMPEAARNLHHLLATPFRYGYAKETRFRKATERPGIFYASEKSSTVLIETAYWRLRFFAASPGVLLPSTTTEYLAFSIAIRVSAALDLTEPPLASGAGLWTASEDYGPCQRLAARARSIDAKLIRYESARDPARGKNIALFDPAAFQEPVPKTEQTWHLRFQDQKLMAFAAAPSAERHDFTFSQFGLTPPT